MSTIRLKPCPDSSVCCDPKKPFYGFINNGSDGSCEISNYKYLAIMDWDACLLGCENAVSGDSVQGFSSPAWGPNDGTSTPRCCSNSGDDPACCCNDCAADPPCEPSYKQNLVDGHRVYEDNGDGTATCIEATGNYSSYLGSIANACAVRESFNPYVGTIQSDQYAAGCGPSIESSCCPDVTEDVPVAYMWN